ncbi:hypothetical protein P171DRAFT_368346 [Karstenula rhodostoma CBS 690.94]|uniref:Autophagy protein n=1 Tax=Karstenula rhodostoma CBS 690.94 TaxID=1392251 RepID=A0A9P4PAW7_9PLEO|nr:hypothetical protein P171DRAFT_368346 [Karstenula rhodostoma CBS 690.94]
MGWLWGSSDSSDAKSNLDPSLQDFLKKEAPTGPTPSLPSKPAERPKEAAQPAQQQPAAPEGPLVPPQSQFQDGRYAHLWKGYVPQNDLENRAKTEQDKLKDIVDSFNDRKAEIGRIALENCALEYMEQFDCFRAPKTYWQTATLCSAESKKFNRCYDMQSKFLKALGYLTLDVRSPEDSERIQMHADKLYQQMMEQEAAIDKAKEEGREPPKYESVLSKQNIARAMSGAPVSAAPVAGKPQPDDGTQDLWKLIKPDSRARYEALLAKMTPAEQDIEKAALVGEIQADIGQAKQVQDTYIEERINRMKRREAGQSTIGDTIKRLWGWDRNA